MAFKKGVSGNSAGRPRGTTEATKLRKQISMHAPEIIQNLFDLAKDGDVQASKILLDRVCPSLKAQALPVHIPTGETLAETGVSAIEATFSGEIPPDVGAMLIKALAEQGKLVESQEIIERLTRVEQMMEAK